MTYLDAPGIPQKRVHADRKNAVAFNRPQTIIGPGGVTGHSDTSPVIQQTSDQVAQWGAEAGRLARRSQYAPVLPQGGNDTSAYPIGPGGVTSAPVTARAAAATGVPQRFLSALIGHESGGDPNAQATTSTATGGGQFIEQTWFDMLGANAERYGHPEIAGAFERDPRHPGGYKLSNPDMRDTLLDLRNDPTWSALMTAEYARQNDLSMRQALGRNLSQGDVYIGHWLGPSEGAAFLQAHDRASRSGSGRGPVAREVVSASTFEHNMPVFYTPDARFHTEGEGSHRKFVHDGGGRLRSVNEVYAAQTGQFGRDPFVAQDRATR